VSRRGALRRPQRSTLNRPRSIYAPWPPAVARC